MPRADLPDDHPNECDHPFDCVEERNVSTYVDGSGGESATELTASATVMFCTTCETIVDVESTGLDDLKHTSAKGARR